MITVGGRGAVGFVNGRVKQKDRGKIKWTICERRRKIFSQSAQNCMISR